MYITTTPGPHPQHCRAARGGEGGERRGRAGGGGTGADHIGVTGAFLGVGADCTDRYATCGNRAAHTSATTSSFSASSSCPAPSHGTWRQHTWRQHSARETPATPCLMSDRHLGRPSGAPPLDYVSPHTSHLSSLTSHVPPLCLPLKHLSSICLSHLRNPAHTPSEKQEERGVGGGREGGREGGRT
jgi:hypothetical protein